MAGCGGTHVDSWGWMALPTEMSVLLSDVRPDKTHLDFSIASAATPVIEKPTEVIIRMEAAPINPSDIGVIFGASRRLDAIQHSATCISAPIDEQFRGSFEKDQYGNSRDGGIVCGNEGAGVVVSAGESKLAQALLGKTVAGAHKQWPPAQKCATVQPTDAATVGSIREWRLLRVVPQGIGTR